MSAAATLIVLGATGDLTGRLLLPALARLSADDEWEPVAFVGAGPDDWTPARFREHARSRLTEHASDLPAAHRESFLEHLDYRRVDVTDPVAVAGLLEPYSDADPVVLYLALPTNLVTTAVTILEGLDLPALLRIAVEKPFGEGLSNARELNAALHRINPDDSTFRVDHVLGMPAIAALPSMTAAVPPIPAGAPISEISILWEETLALEGRAAFYDQAGALKDLLQNHLLQILCMITLDPRESAGTLAERRFRALQAVQTPTAAQARSDSRRARYTAGRLAADDGAIGRNVPDYIAEEGVDAGRQTETLAEVVLRVSTPRWAGTRFVLRAGKAMGERRRGIQVSWGRGSTITRSWIDVDQPARVSATPPDPGVGNSGESAPLEQIAYRNVLSGVLSGSPDLSVSAQEAERAWQIFEPILQAWAAGEVPLTDYPAGSS